jgi:hypothetical protein
MKLGNYKNEETYHGLHKTNRYNERRGPLVGTAEGIEPNLFNKSFVHGEVIGLDASTEFRTQPHRRTLLQEEIGGEAARGQLQM